MTMICVKVGPRGEPFLIFDYPAQDSQNNFSIMLIALSLGARAHSMEYVFTSKH